MINAFESQSIKELAIHMCRNGAPNIRWGCFSTNLRDMHRSGWTVDISETVDYQRGFDKLVSVRTKAPDGSAVGYGSASIDNRMFEQMKMSGGDYPVEFHIALEFGKDVQVHGLPEVQWMAYNPEVVQTTIEYNMPIHAFSLFEGVIKQSEEVIIPSYDMADLMEMIGEMQAPIKEKYFEGKCTNVQKEIQILSATA